MKNALLTLLESSILTAMFALISLLNKGPTQVLTLFSDFQHGKTENTGCTAKSDFSFAQMGADSCSTLISPTRPTPAIQK